MKKRPKFFKMAKMQAEDDIRKELKAHGRSFIRVSLKQLREFFGNEE